mmetsp:Transcript_110694/g.319755  ORF Transcript_110694/g.319755 Transcript_110694/m.319755 type:complete len:252 (-) Transcript_110694:89-844(-)
MKKPAAPEEHSLFAGIIPVQVGPASPYARNVTHWMQAIVFLQVACCVMQVVIFYAFVAAFWTGILAVVGVLALKQDMNITYICIWGIGCLLNGICDTLGLILPLIFDILFLTWIEIPLRALVPVAELLGAAFAWHLYLDYYRTGGGAMGHFLENQPLADPLGNLITEVDPMEYQSLLKGAKKQGGILRDEAKKAGLDKQAMDFEKQAEEGLRHQFQGLSGAVEQGIHQAGIPEAEGLLPKPQTKRKQAPCC